MVEQNTSLMAPIVVLRRPVVIEEALTVDVVTAPPGAFSVEKVPIPAVIVEAVILLKSTLPGNTKLDTLRVDVVIPLVVKLDIYPVCVLIFALFIVLAFIVLTLSGSGMTILPLETLIVEKVPTDALILVATMLAVVNLPV
jgi:hypothetical protein